MSSKSSCMKAKLPFRAVSMTPHNSKVMSGKGMGSVLLRTGGPGAASSYSDMDDFIRTTGIDPYSKSRKVVGMGVGGKKLAEKLEKLTIIQPSAKRRNITM
jgi:hypothetical protein